MIGSGGDSGQVLLVTPRVSRKPECLINTYLHVDLKMIFMHTDNVVDGHGECRYVIVQGVRYSHL